MILILAFLAGAALGVIRARRRGGTLADQAQYGLAHGFAVLVAVAFASLISAMLFGNAPF